MMLLKSLGPVGSQPLQKGGSGGLAGPATYPNQPHNPGSENRHIFEASLHSEGERALISGKLNPKENGTRKILCRLALLLFVTSKTQAHCGAQLGRCSSIPAPILSLVSLGEQLSPKPSSAAPLGVGSFV